MDVIEAAKLFFLRKANKQEFLMSATRTMNGSKPAKALGLAAAVSRPCSALSIENTQEPSIRLHAAYGWNFDNKRNPEDAI